MSARTSRRWLGIVIALQVLVLVCLPLFAGPRMPSGATVVLEATGRTQVDAKDMPANEIWLDYGFEDVELPSSLDPGDVAYVELIGGNGDEPARIGATVSSPEQLPTGATWIKLPVVGPESGEAELENGPIGVWFDEDDARARELKKLLDDDGSVLVTVKVDQDGDPEIEGVRPAS